MVSAADEITTAAATLTEAIQDNMKASLSKLNMPELKRLAAVFTEAAAKIS